MSLTGSLVERPALSEPCRPPSAPRRAQDVLATALITGAFLMALVPLIWVLLAVVSRGLGGLRSAEWWSSTATALYGSIGQGLLAVALAAPVGLLVAVYLVEYGRGAPARVVSVLVDVLAGVPAVVVALVVAAMWSFTFGVPESDFVVALALAPVILPWVIRAGEQSLRAVPDEIREAGLALGLPGWRVIVRVVLPCAHPDALVAVSAALARAFGEAAAALVVIGFGRSLGDSTGGAPASLPSALLAEVHDPAAAGRVWATALALVLLVTAGHLAAVMIVLRATVRRKRGR